MPKKRTRHPSLENAGTPSDRDVAPPSAGQLVGIKEALDAAFRLAAIVESSDDAIISKDLDGVITSWNKGAERIFGYSAKEAIGRPVSILIPLDRVDEESQILKRIRKGERIEHYETLRRRRDGSYVDISLTVSPIKDTSGTIVGASKIAREITERKRAEEALRASEEQFRTLADNIAQFAWMADEKGSIFWYNKRWYEYTGTTFEDMQGSSWRKKVHHPDHVDRVVTRIQASWDTGEPWEDIFPLRGRDGNYRWFLSRAQPIRDASGRVVRWLGTNTDITEQHAVEETLRRGALHDALTDLPNRAYFLERVSQALARMRRDPGYRVAVLLLDCDGFKAVNDTLGHAAGDRLLMEIAARLRTCVRPGDVVARLGGDEFTVLLEEITGVPDVEHAARRIQDSLAAPLALQDREIVTTASIGAALGQPDYGQPQDLLRDADLAMYHAKQQGRARFQVFDVALRDSAQERSDLEADLRNALERRELRLVFQPIVELETGAPRAFEALLRWHRPKHGVVAPLDFVALAEQTGLIFPIGNWVLQEGCRHARSWQDAFPAAAPVRISVNLSAKQLGHPDIAGEVRTAVQDAGIAPSCLILEIAERVLMENVESSTAVLHQLREVGVDVHMDDFGTGPSSLSSLSRFPLQGIKVDSSLVHRMGARRTDLEIVRSMVDLAKSLGLGVIAEGVETVAQRERLIAFGCELGQGHLFAKPFEANAAASFRARSEQLGRRSA
jgi:diguanylate cyclase (GGDEF)-like protein/PAS domain S-box-containing protein